MFGPVPAWVVLLLAGVNLALLFMIGLIFWASRNFSLLKRRPASDDSNSDENCSPEFEVRVSKGASMETRYEIPWTDHPHSLHTKDYHYASTCVHKNSREILNNFDKNERGIIVVKTT